MCVRIYLVPSIMFYAINEPNCNFTYVYTRVAVATRRGNVVLEALAKLQIKLQMLAKNINQHMTTIIVNK